ncbi:hypothetical protein GCM10023238_37420 [Streptomyces heliomycini]
MNCGNAALILAGTRVRMTSKSTEGTEVAPVTQELRRLLAGLTAVRDGTSAPGCRTTADGLMGDIAKVFNGNGGPAVGVHLRGHPRRPARSAPRGRWAARLRCRGSRAPGPT